MGNQEDKIREKETIWKEKVVPQALSRFPILKENPGRFYSPLDVGEIDFLQKIGYPGMYPFTASPYPFNPTAGLSKMAARSPNASVFTRAAMYSGYGAPEDTRDYYQQLLDQGGNQGPNLAFDLPTQLGYDSDNPMVEGEVGKVGVSVDNLRDFEVIYEPYQGDLNLDRIASNYTINAPVIYILAMYAALAEKRGIPLNKLQGTPQNDILKEYIARQMYIFPPKHALRLFRDILVFMNKNMPKMNITSVAGYHIREAGANRTQDLAFTMANMCAYMQVGVDAGLQVDDFAQQMPFMNFGGSLEFLEEIALQRAARRMFARIMKEKFGAKNPRSMILRQANTVMMGASNSTLQRPLNNLTRGVIAAVAGALCGGNGLAAPPFDEALGLGWSLEAQQLMRDAMRIIQCESKLCDVVDPFAGSYCMEKMTDDIEAAAMAEMKKIEDMGGVVPAIEQGYMQREIARGAHEDLKKVNKGERLIVGVNCYTAEQELNVETTRLVPHPYDPDRRNRAEGLQRENLAKVKASRDGELVKRLVKELEDKARDEHENLFPHLIECAKAYATLQEVCDAFRNVFGVFESPAII
jgi:methylmalonyl-CoA mutase, N-terminal domain